MAGNAENQGVTPEIAVGLLQDALVNMQQAGVEVLVGNATINNTPHLIIAIAGASTVPASDGLQIVLAGDASTPPEALP